MQEALIENELLFLVLVAIWTLPWKGFALWRAAKKSDLKWFVPMLVLNTLAILEITYIFFFSKKKQENNK